MEEEEKKIEIVSGDGSNLDISPVYDHLENEKPKHDKPKNIVIPKEKKKDDNNDKDEATDEED